MHEIRSKSMKISVRNPQNSPVENAIREGTFGNIGNYSYVLSQGKYDAWSLILMKLTQTATFRKFFGRSPPDPPSTPQSGVSE